MQGKQRGVIISKATTSNGGTSTLVSADDGTLHSTNKKSSSTFTLCKKPMAAVAVAFSELISTLSELAERPLQCSHIAVVAHRTHAQCTVAQHRPFPSLGMAARGWDSR
eukprot:scpid52525/ scgid27969/ 